MEIQAAGPTGTITITLPNSPAVGTNYKISAGAQVLYATLINASGTNTFSQNNYASNTLRMFAGTGGTVEIMYKSGVWNVLGGLFDVVRCSKQSFITVPTGLGIGLNSAQIHFPWAVSATSITATANATLTTPTYGTYIVNCAAAATITLPAITTSQVGSRIVFRKTGTLASVISVNCATGQTIYIQNNITTVASPTTTVLMSATQASMEVVCLTSTSWAII